MEVYMLYYNSNCDEGEIFIGAFSSVEEINKFTARAFNTEFNGDLSITWIPDAVYGEDLRYKVIKLNEVDDLVVDQIKDDMKPFDDISEANENFLASIEQARKVGVPEDKILKSINDIDNFFMGG